MTVDVPTCWMNEMPMPSVDDLRKWRDFSASRKKGRSAARVDDDLKSGSKGEAVFEFWLHQNIPSEHWHRVGTRTHDFEVFGVRIDVKTRDWGKHMARYGHRYDSVPAARGGRIHADMYVVVWLHEDGSTATIAGGVHAYELVDAPLHPNTDAPGTREVKGDSVLLSPIDFSRPAWLRVPRSAESLSG